MADEFQITMKTKPWYSMYEQLIPLFSSDVVSFIPEEPAIQSGDPELGGELPFLNGRVAMIFGTADLIERINQNKVSFEWDLVSGLESLNHSSSIGASPSPIYAIYRHAENKQSAWKYIQYRNEKGTLQLLAKSVPQLSSLNRL